MKRSLVVIWAAALSVAMIPLLSVAGNPPAPHYGFGVVCQTCHVSTPDGPGHLDGVVASSPAVYNNICQNCHRPGDAGAAAKPLASSDASLIFGGQGTTAGATSKQTSHRWDGPLTNPSAGALPPIQGAMTTASSSYAISYDLSGRTGNQLACVRCHAPHLNPNPNGNVLRMANDNDQMCMDCHRSRNQQSHLSGTHPVNVNYNNAQGSFNKPALIANPANTSSDLNTKLSANGNIICSTCHGVHYTDSRSSTFDGPSSAKNGRYNYANLSSGDGYLLRTDRRGAAVNVGSADKLNICTNCHAGKKNHNAKGQDIQCTDCHGAHVEYDATNNATINPQNTPNAFLIRRNITNGTTSSKIYFRYTGSQREYKTAQNTGVCQGCHAIPTSVAAHATSNTAKECNACHAHGSQAGAFSPSCDGCHGNPPTTTVFGGPNGLATPATGALGGTATTSPTSAGAHLKHVTTHSMACNTCHNGYEQLPMPSKTIDMSFAINPTNVPGFKGTVTGGTYNNTGALLNGYSFVPGGSGTNRTCSTVYCHGGTLTPGINPNPNWTGNASQVSCGTCHSTDGDVMTMGSHTAHAGPTLGINMACEDCHSSTPITGTAHMQGSVQWDLSAIGATAKYAPAGGTPTTVGETGKIAPSTAYGSCSNITCHGQGSPTWGAVYTNGAAFPYSSAQCGKCHAADGSVSSVNPFYSTAMPKVVSNTDSKVGAHTSHLASTDSISAALTCSDCHGSVASVTQTGHMNGTVDFNWGALATNNSTLSPSYSAGSCSNTYCHGATLTGGTNAGKNPTWNVPFLPATLTPAACGTCHGFPPATPTHIANNVQTPTGFPTSSCGCHPTINPSGTSYANIFITGANSEKHLDGKVDGGGSCNACHGYPPANKRFVGATGSWIDAKMENYTGGGGSHTVAGHIKPTAVASEGFANCSQCHNSADHVMSPVAFNPSSNIKVRLDKRIRFNGSILAKYSSNKKDNAQHVTGRCASVACHFQKTPKW